MDMCKCQGSIQVYMILPEGDYSETMDGTIIQWVGDMLPIARLNNNFHIHFSHTLKRKIVADIPEFPTLCINPCLCIPKVQLHNSTLHALQTKMYM